MPAEKLTRRLFWGAEVLLVAGTVAAAILLSRPEEWQPLPLVALLLALTLLGESLSLEIGDGRLSTSLVALVLDASLLGPAPAAAFGIVAVTLTSAHRRLPPASFLNNVATHAFAPFAGGLVVLAFVSDVHSAHGQHLAESVTLGLVVLVAFTVVLGLDFLGFALAVRVEEGRSLSRQARELLLPLLPGHLASGVLATILAVAYLSAGLPILFGSIVVLLIFRQLTVALLRSEERAEKLEASIIHRAGLQMGILRTLARVINARDKTAGRHAAAVARYAQALVAELGLSEDQQDLVHAAGLLHEIGKFPWPDRVLHAKVVKDEDMEIVRSHPQEGAILVGSLDGYGDVAEAILYHHERMDGAGYPAGLIGNEIPLASRILAICSAYDSMTAGRTYSSAIAPEEAMDELRNAARNGQLDPELVETFLVVLKREGSTFAADSAFEAELDFERRVRKLAEPTAADPGSPHSGRTSSAGRGWRAGVSSLKQRALDKV